MTFCYPTRSQQLSSPGQRTIYVADLTPTTLAHIHNNIRPELSTVCVLFQVRNSSLHPRLPFLDASL